MYSNGASYISFIDLNIESKLFHCIVSYITMLLKNTSMLMQAVDCIMKKVLLCTRNSLNKNKQSLLNNQRSFKSYLPTDLLIFNVDDEIAVP